MVFGFVRPSCSLRPAAWSITTVEDSPLTGPRFQVLPLLLRSSKAIYINAWPNRRRWKERDYAEAATRSRTPQCRGGVQDPQTGSKPPCSRRLDRQSPHHLFELARVAHRQDR